MTVRGSVFIREQLGPRRLTPGIRLRVELDQIIDRRPGPHYVGKAQVLDDGRLMLWLTGSSEAGRTAKAMLADDILEAVLVGPGPAVRLQVS